jgi:hypothetical protein
MDDKQGKLELTDKQLAAESIEVFFVALMKYEH